MSIRMWLIAYAYDSIDSMLNGSTPGNSNVFALNQPPSQSSANLGQSLQPGGSSGQGTPATVKSDISGDLSNAQPSGGGAATNSAQGSSDKGAENAAFQANVNQVAPPSFFNTIGQGITSTGANLSNQADQYLAAQAANNASYLGGSSPYTGNASSDASGLAAQNAILNGAVGGDVGDIGQVQGLLAKSAPTSVSTFNPTGTTVSGANLLSTPAGLQQLLAQQNGPGYTKGMAAFDQSLLANNQNAVNALSSLQNQYGNYQKDLSSDLTNLPTQALTGAQNALTGVQNAARSSLNSTSQGVLSQGNSTADALNQQIAADQANSKSILQQAITGMLPQIQNQLQSYFGNGLASPSLTNYQNQLLSQLYPGGASGSTAANPYLSFNGPISALQALSPTQASQYNIINSLLGNNQPQATGSDNPSLYNVNTNLLQNTLLNGAEGLRNTQMAGINSQIQAILNNANTKASNYESGVANNISNIPSSLTSYANTFLPQAQSSGQIVPYSNAQVQNFIQQYMAKNPVASDVVANSKGGLQGSQFINSDMASQLNALEQQLGSNQTYGAGQYANGYTPSLYNKQSFQDQLLAYLQGQKVGGNDTNMTPSAPAPTQSAPLNAIDYLLGNKVPTSTGPNPLSPFTGGGPIALPNSGGQIPLSPNQLVSQLNGSGLGSQGAFVPSTQNIQQLSNTIANNPGIQTGGQMLLGNQVPTLGDSLPSSGGGAPLSPNQVGATLSKAFGF